ncbi:MAG: SoxR reducing system RseC family protein [Salinivirgaceae bacterium]|jgi:sigma-E factor negative regulatory protein RseC|nr:SoxR reducing system RseC family protein [Salinivirgaceae bacterium]
MIEHDGIIVSSSPTKAKVRILNQSACISCQMKGNCNLSDMKEKFIDVKTMGKTYAENDKVTIIGTETMGFKALFYGYMLPFLILLFTVILLTLLKIPELTVGLIGLSTLIPYYIGLKLFHKKIENKFSFYLKNR